MSCKVKGKKVTCTVKQATSAKRHQLRWTLRRDGRVVSHGKTGAARLQSVLNHLRQGHYALRIAGQPGATAIAVG